MIELGSRVRDLITGFEGAVIGRTEWLYGCARIVVEGLELKDGKPHDPQWFDEQRVEELEQGKYPVSPARCGIDITLGNKVKDKVTGFTGIAVAKTIWSSGNVTIQIEPTTLEKGEPVPSHAFEYARIEKIEDTKPPVSAQSSATSGGPQNDPSVSRSAPRQ